MLKRESKWRIALKTMVTAKIWYKHYLILLKSYVFPRDDIFNTISVYRAYPFSFGFKCFCMDREWTEINTVTPHLPDGTPNFVKLEWAKQASLEEIREKLTKCNVKFSTNTISWWDNYLHEIESQQR